MGTYQNELEDAAYEEKYLALNTAVTPEQVSTAVSQYLMPPNLTVSVLLPKEEAKDFRIEQLEKIVSGFRPAEKTAMVRVSGSAGAVFRELPNGIKVVLVPDNSNPVISFRIACLGGKRFENTDTQGIMNFISRMLDKGAGNMTDIDIAGKVDDMGGSLDGFSGNDSFGLYASFFSRYWDQALELLFQLYTDPTFPQDKVDRERTLVLNSIKTEPDTPTEYVINILNKTLFPNFPYGFDKLGSEASVAGFTVEELRQTYQRFAVPSNTVIAVVGEMDAQKMGDKISQIFGSIPAKTLEMPEIPAEEPLDKGAGDRDAHPTSQGSPGHGIQGNHFQRSGPLSVGRPEQCADWPGRQVVSPTQGRGTLGLHGCFVRQARTVPWSFRIVHGLRHTKS